MTRWEGEAGTSDLVLVFLNYGSVGGLPRKGVGVIRPCFLQQCPVRTKNFCKNFDRNLLFLNAVHKKPFLYFDIKVKEVNLELAQYN